MIRVPPFIFRIFNGIGEIRKSLGYNMVSVLLSLLLSPKFKIYPNHSYLSQLDVTYKTPDLMSHFLPP
ncbi:hypothetical protein L3C55_04090, partial [Streptococcus pneumoniae]|nr:hypothetical protein [Streptococcus pneumoniae]